VRDRRQDAGSIQELCWRSARTRRILSRSGDLLSRAAPGEVFLAGDPTLLRPPRSRPARRVGIGGAEVGRSPPYPHRRITRTSSRISGAYPIFRTAQMGGRPMRQGLGGDLNVICKPKHGLPENNWSIEWGAAADA
jgi:hypothetical protein